MDTINKYILWQILDYCDIYFIYNIGLLCKRIRLLVNQYMGKNRYLCFDTYTKVVQPYVTKILINRIIVMNLSIYPNITHLVIDNFTDDTIKHFPNIEYLKCSKFSVCADGNKLNNLKDIVGGDLHLDAVLRIAPNVEVVAGFLDYGETICFPKIKKLDIYRDGKDNVDY